MKKDSEEKKTRKFYEMLQKRSKHAKEHPEKLIPLENVLKKHEIKKVSR